MGSDTAAAIPAAALLAKAGRVMAAAAVMRCVAVLAAAVGGRAAAAMRVGPCDVWGGLEIVERRPSDMAGLSGLFKGGAL